LDFIMTCSKLAMDDTKNWHSLVSKDEIVSTVTTWQLVTCLQWS